MNMEVSPSEITTVSSGTIDPLRGVAWLRAGLTAALWLVTIGALGVGIVWISKGEFSTLAGKFIVFFVGIPLLVVSLVSTLISSALFRNSSRGLKAALIFDVIVVVPLVLMLIAWVGGRIVISSVPAERLLIGSIASTLVLLFGIEAAWLLVARRGKR